MIASQLASVAAVGSEACIVLRHGGVALFDRNVQPVTPVRSRRERRAPARIGMNAVSIECCTSFAQITFTRFAAFSLLVLTFVATAAVHWPDMISMWSDLAKGYAITDKGFGNFKLPLLFCVMLLPLIFQGPGKLSLDFVLAKALKADTMPAPQADAYAWSLACLVFGIPFLMLIPMLGAALIVLAVALALFGRFARA